MSKRLVPDGPCLLFLLLSVLLLLPFGISTKIDELDASGVIRQVFVIILLLLFMVVIRGVLMQRGIRCNVWIIGCCIYGTLIVMEALVHYSALVHLPESFVLNVDGLTAQQWVNRNRQFTILYLYFPVLCLLQYWFFRRLRLSSMVQILVGIMLLSLLCAVFSRLAPAILDPRSFMAGRRFQGVMTSPNAYALSAFLLLPWIAFSLLGKARRVEKLLSMTCLLLALWGVVESGSRTASVMILAFLILAPAIVARGRPQKRLRLLLRLVVPVVLVIAIGVGTVVVFSSDGHDAHGKLGARLADIGTRVKDQGIPGIFFQREARGFHAMQAGAMFLRAPLAGWGPGGFYREFPNATFLATGRIRPTKDSALNHYLMIGGDFGVIILVLNLLLVLTPLCGGFRALKRHDDGQIRLVIRVLILSNVLFLLGITFMPPSYFPEVLWLWTGQLACLVILAEKAGVSDTIGRKNLSKGLTLMAGACVALVILGTVVTSHGALGYRQRHQRDWWPWRYVKGCYGIERWYEGEGCWCKDDAVLQFPYFEAPPETLRLRIGAYHPDIQQNPVTVQYGGIAGPESMLTLQTRSWQTLSIPVTDAYLYSPTASHECRHWKLPWLPPTAKSVAPRDLWYVVLSLQTSRTWKPAEWGEPRDPRELALRVLLPETKRGRGCYHAEQWYVGNVRWCQKDAVLEVPFTGIPPISVNLRLRASHPDIHSNPVVVRFGAIGGPTDSLTMTDHTWQTLRIPVTSQHLWSTEKTRDTEWWQFLGLSRPQKSPKSPQQRERQYFVLSLHTSRVWIPNEWGVSDDDRQLGVAVLLPRLNSADWIVRPDKRLRRTESFHRASLKHSQFQGGSEQQSETGLP